MNFAELLKTLIGLAKMALPFVGNDVRKTIERAITVPQADLTRICKGMTKEDTEVVIALHRRAQAITADMVCMVVTRGELRPREDRVMLLVVVDDEQSEHQEPREDAGGDSDGQGGDEQCRGDGTSEQRGGGQQIPPAFPGHFGGVGAGGEDQFGTGPELGWLSIEFATVPGLGGWLAGAGLLGPRWQGHVTPL